MEGKACFVSVVASLSFVMSFLLNPSSLLRLTCSYLSCKVDEFNVSSTQFVGNLVQESPAGQERVLEQILEYELLLIQQLNFHLVVHNPYRPLEGLLIDLKVVWRGGFKSQILCPILVSFFKIISDTVSYTGEPRIFEEKRWWLSDSGSHDWCRTAVSSISDCPGSYTQQRLKSRPQLGKVTTVSVSGELKMIITFKCNCFSANCCLKLPDRMFGVEGR